MTSPVDQIIPTIVEPLQDFRYSPLPNNTSIRLVRRDGVDDDGVLRIKLITVDLNANQRVSPYIKRETPSDLDWPPFHCLSYTWGNPHAYGTNFKDSFEAHAADYSADNLLEIRCDGKTLKIRKNLHDFLTDAPTGWTADIRNRPHPETGRILLHDRVDGSIAVLHMYVGLGDNVKKQDNRKQTPLHLAAQLGKVDSVLVLLKGGASTDIKDDEDRTPEDLATIHGHADVVEALQRAKNHGVEDATRDVLPFRAEDPDAYIWIDALCIDQSDLQERASQVELMCWIYSSASYVIAWLGAEDDHIDYGLSALATLSNMGTHTARAASHRTGARLRPTTSATGCRTCRTKNGRAWPRYSCVSGSAGSGSSKKQPLRMPLSCIAERKRWTGPLCKWWRECSGCGPLRSATIRRRSIFPSWTWPAGLTTTSRTSTTCERW